VSGLATRSSGGLIAGLGSVLVAFFLVDAVASPDPVYWVIQSYPLGLSVALVCMGGLLARGRLVADRFVPRLLAWMVVGIVVFALFLLWFYGLAVLFRGRVPLDPPIGIVTLPALGALAGLLIGTYDARAVAGKRAVQRLSETNETLRIATGELVEETDRDALERTVCERLIEADAFDVAWIGRYDREDGRVRPVAWAGLDDDTVESLAIPIDCDRTTGRAVSHTPDRRAGDATAFREAVVAGTAGNWRTALERHRVGSIAVAPIAGSDRVYGVVAVRTDRRDAFDDHQRDVFAELGETVGHAIDSIRAHDALETRERELVTQNDRLDEFVGVVSHDLRNPLNVILAQVARMRGTVEGDGLDAIEHAGRRMEEIIADLLALSRVSRAVVDLEPVRLAGIADESWRNVETDGAELDILVSRATTVRADPARLRTVFENLFRNAREHNDTPLTVRVEPLDPRTGDGESLRGFAVEDDGAGIPTDERGDVFDHGYTTNADGTGFGLSIVREVVDAHGWDIAVREGRAGGARFEVTGVESPD
jgi:signal transduction histidine kinase